MNLSTHIVMFQSKRREKKKKDSNRLMATLNVLASCFLLLSTRLSGLGPCWVSRAIHRLWASATAASSRGCNCRDHFPPFPTSLVCRSFAFSFYIFFFFRQVSLQEPDFILHLGCCVSTLTALHRHIVRLSYVRQFGYALASAGVLPHRTRGRLPRHPRSFGWQL